MRKLSIFSIVLLFILQAMGVNAMAPSIFYTDITSGPNTGGENNNGCYLTIAGRGFGSSRGSSTVTIGGGEVAEYKVWSDNEISVQLGPDVQTGSIIVTVNGQKASPPDLPYGEPGDLQFTVRDADIYFIAPGGDNSNPGTFELPKAGVYAWGGATGVKSVMGGGDFLYARGGTHTPDDSWGAFFRLDEAWNGSEGAPTVISGYPGETVNVSGNDRVFVTNGQRHDWVFAHFNPEPRMNIVNLSDFPERIRIIDIDMSGVTGSTGSLVARGARHFYVYGCKFHDNAPSATNYAHLVYFRAVPVGSDSEGSHHVYFGWNQFYNSTNDVNGLNLYDEHPPEIKPYDFIYVHDNQFSNISREGLFLTGLWMNNVWVWNNIFYNCGRDANRGGMWIVQQDPASTLHIFNNTFYGNQYYEIGLANRNNLAGKVIIKNNIFYSTTAEKVIHDKCYGDGTWPEELITASDNLYYIIGSATIPSFDTNPIEGDPQFVDLSARDFHLLETSPAIDAGTSDGASFVASDFDGSVRPRGAGYDIGAYEYVVGGPPDTIPPAAPVDLTAAPIGSITLNWTTNAEADLAGYNVYRSTTSGSGYAKLNTVLISGVTYLDTDVSPGTTYYYVITAVDTSNNESDYSVEVNASPLADTTPPVISDVSANSITDASAEVSWTTDEPSDSQIEYGTTTSYGSFTTLDGTLVTNHSQTISGLTPGTIYHYRVRSKDADDNQAISGDFTFTTQPSDTDPPVISGVSANSITDASAEVSWTTDEPSDSQIEYGTTISYGSFTTLDGTLVTNHSQTITGLTSDTLYHYRVRSKDADDNQATSGDFTFTTQPEQPSIFSNMMPFGDTDNWTPLTSEYWAVAVEPLSGDWAYYLGDTDRSEHEYTLFDGDSYDDFTLTVKARTAEPASNGWRDYQIIFGFQDHDNHYLAFFNASDDPDTNGIIKRENGALVKISQFDLPPTITDDAYHDIEVSRLGSNITVKMDGTTVFTATDSTFAGKIGLGSYNDSAYFDDVNVIVPTVGQPGKPIHIDS